MITPKQKKMGKAEMRRQLFHGGLGVSLVVLLYLDVLNWFGEQPLLSAFSPLQAPARPLLFVLIIGAVLVLLSRRYRIPGICWLLKRFERPKVMKVFPGKGSFFYILGAFVVISLFDKQIAMASIVILALGDSSSHLIGKYIGRVKHPFNSVKFLEGHIAGALIGALGAMLFVTLPVALAAASIAMFVEGIDVGSRARWILDDNLVVPLTAGVVMFLWTIRF